MKINLLILFIFLFTSIQAEKPIVKWSNSFGGSFDDFSQSVTTDTSGNVYIAGYFLSSDITFGSTSLKNSNSNNLHIFVAKYDSLGKVLWAKSSGDNDIGYTRSITIDKNGNILVCGIFNSSSITFGSITLTNYDGYGKWFLVKYDPNGNVIWAKSPIISTSSNGLTSLSTDKAGNIYALGYFQDLSIIFGSTTLYNNIAPYQDICLVKFDTSGNTLWANNLGGENHDVGNSLSVDLNGNIFVTGSFTSSIINLGKTVLVNKGPGNSDILIVKYDTNGNLLWGKSAGGVLSDNPNSIVTDLNGNV